MLSYKQYKDLMDKQLMESTINTAIYNVPTLGIVGANGTSLEEAKKMKKKMGMEMPDDEDVPPEDDMDDEEDAETGDGEVVDPASEKDDPDADADVEAETPPEEDDEEGGDEEMDPEMKNSPLMRMKKKMNKMKKKMSADAKDCEKKFGKKVEKKEDKKSKKNIKKEDVQWWNSLQDMLKQPKNIKGSGFGFQHNEDALYPEIDVNTGLIKKPELENE